MLSKHNCCYVLVLIKRRRWETVIRLATAHSKARLSPTVDPSDGQVAMDLLTFALYHEQQQQSFTKRDLPTSPKPKKRPRVSISDDDEASQASVDDDVVSSTDAAAAKVLE